MKFGGFQPSQSDCFCKSIIFGREDVDVQAGVPTVFDVNKISLGHAVSAFFTRPRKHVAQRRVNATISHIRASTRSTSKLSGEGLAWPSGSERKAGRADAFVTRRLAVTPCRATPDHMVAPKLAVEDEDVSSPSCNCPLAARLGAFYTPAL
jgi:hypothetical protein